MTSHDSTGPVPVKKAYYSIREVCQLTGLEPHVLRYWEGEFPSLRPKKNRAGNRAYRDKDIETIQFIKYLLYEEKYTISGAKKKIAEMREQDQPLTSPPAAAGAIPDAVPSTDPAAAEQHFEQQDLFAAASVPPQPGNGQAALLDELKGVLAILRS